MIAEQEAVWEAERIVEQAAEERRMSTRLCAEAHYVENPDCPTRWGANQEVEDASEEEAETGGSDRENGHTKEKEDVTR